MRAPMLALAGVCVVIGLAPGLLAPVLARATAAWHPGWGAGEPTAPLSSLGAAAVLVAVLALAGAILLAARVRRNGLSRAGTWDCGYAAPSARMQYTSGSLGGLATRWFFWILRPQRRLRRPRGPLPADAILVERHPETVLDLVISPAAAVVLSVSSAVRRLQHGRLQSYILYIVAGIAVLALVVLLGGRP